MRSSCFRRDAGNCTRGRARSPELLRRLFQILTAMDRRRMVSIGYPSQTSMKKEIVRLALLQMTLIIYSVLGVAVLLRVFHGSPAPDIFAKHVRDWGFLF